jgi:hypothetical protein
MPTNSYDLIVIGNDFAGLVAATLCAKRGMRVLILDHGGRPPSYQIGPHRLPVDPLPLCGMSSPAIKRVLAELHLGHTLKRKLDERPISFQFVAPDMRLDISADDHALASELRREFADPDRVLAACARASELGGALDAVLGTDSEFPPKGFWKRRELDRNASRIGADAGEWLAELEDRGALAALTGLPALMGAHADSDSLSPVARARSFHLWRQGTPRIRGDWDSLREIFLDRLTKGNGETREGRVAELTFRWGRVSGVRLDSGEELGAGHVIAALPVDQLVPLVEKKAPKRLLQCAEAMTVSGYRYTLNLVVDESGVPEGMSSPVLITADPDKPLVGDNAVAIYLDAPDHEARVAVSVSTICPLPAEGQKLDDVFADLRVRLRERIEMVMPFFSEHVLVAHSPHEAAPPEGMNVELGTAMPVPPSPVWSHSLEAALGVSALPYSVGLKHLTIASSQILPQLGLEGSFAAGWYAARMACDDAGKKRDYLKDEVIASG